MNRRIGVALIIAQRSVESDAIESQNGLSVKEIKIIKQRGGEKYRICARRKDRNSILVNRRGKKAL